MNKSMSFKLRRLKSQAMAFAVLLYFTLSVACLGLLLSEKRESLNEKLTAKVSFLEAYSRGFLHELQMGNSKSVEQKVSLLVRNHLFTKATLKFGSSLLTAEAEPQVRAAPDWSAWLLRSLLVQTTLEVALKDLTGTSWGTLQANVNLDILGLELAEDLTKFAFLFACLFLIVLGVLILMVGAWEKPLKRLLNHVRKFSEFDGTPDKFAVLLSERPQITIGEWEELYEAFANAMSKCVKLQEDLREAEGQRAIAQMVQMISHDAKKPFSMMSIGLDLLSSTTDPNEIRELSGMLIKDVQIAMANITGLFQDIMEIGSSDALFYENISPEEIIENAISEVFYINPDSDIELNYNFSHKVSLSIDVSKVGRIFSNVLDNAVQAMKQKGIIWFQTRELTSDEGKKFIEFIIGNSGSAIAKEDLPNLFDVFYTRNKKGGTGLGLAIAKKIVAIHGGEISCRSEISVEYPNGKVEFIFSLPASKTTLSVKCENLPAHSRMRANELESLKNAAQKQQEFAELASDELQKEIRSISENLGRPIELLVADDELIYREGVSALISQLEQIKQSVSVRMARSSNEVYQTIAQFKPDLAILDVDLGTSSESGFEISSALRLGALCNKIYIHSNRMTQSDHRSAIESGADGFLPKPIGRIQLLKLVVLAGRHQLEVKQKGK